MLSAVDVRDALLALDGLPVQGARAQMGQHDARLEPASFPLLSDALSTVLEQELAVGPVSHGWPDQTWSPSRSKSPA
ncbi:hypothetical protein ACE1SV_34880 [Streptomyces sp. E-15]